MRSDFIWHGEIHLSTLEQDGKAPAQEEVERIIKEHLIYAFEECDEFRPTVDVVTLSYDTREWDAMPRNCDDWEGDDDF